MKRIYGFVGQEIRWGLILYFPEKLERQFSVFKLRNGMCIINLWFVSIGLKFWHKGRKDE